jgi:hypothetical protein
MADRFNNSVQPLEDRIRALRSEIDSIIDDRVAVEAAAHPNIPAAVLRKILTLDSGIIRKETNEDERTGCFHMGWGH